MEKRPNVVIITIDECKASAMSAYGNKYVDTPASEYAKKNGVMFENAFVCHPKCVPSRCGLLSGRYVHTNGHRTLPGYELTKDEISLAGMLKNKGYRTAMFGKNHTVEEGIKSDIFDEYTKEIKSRAQSIPHDKNMYLDDLPWKAFYRGRWDDTNDDEHQDYYDALSGIEFIKENKDRPFFALFNLSMPHPVYYGMSPYIEKIEKMGVPAPKMEPIDEAPETLKMYRDTYDVDKMTDKQRTAVVEAYYSMTSYVDNLVMKIYEQIEALGLKDNTIIVYTSDHGDFAGEHGCYEKYDTFFYDCLVKVPLFIQYPPRLKPRKLNGIVENVDIMPTILELMGIPAPENVHGKSCAGYMLGEKDGHKEYAFCEGGVEKSVVDRAPHYDSVECERMRPNYYLKQKVLVDHPESMYRAKMIRTLDWKFIYRISGYHELYDLQNDPEELKNVYRKDHEQVHKLMPKLLDWEIETEPDYPHIENLYA